jgi:hypothetical protein
MADHSPSEAEAEFGRRLPGMERRLEEAATP